MSFGVLRDVSLARVRWASRIGLLLYSVTLLCVRCCVEAWVFEVVGWDYRAPLVELVWVESAALGWAFLFLFWWEMMVWLLRG